MSAGIRDAAKNTRGQGCPRSLSSPADLQAHEFSQVGSRNPPPAQQDCLHDQPVPLDLRRPGAPNRAIECSHLEGRGRRGRLAQHDRGHLPANLQASPTEQYLAKEDTAIGHALKVAIHKISIVQQDAAPSRRERLRAFQGTKLQSRHLPRKHAQSLFFG
jgi:hypothetical protein